ncbi:glycyl-tRNA synthetase beta chain [[Luteovulum] sphaeroides subsp. megalophilum]|uniref:glycine--tRNA ligase subunit beta n=1 Tax=Cereibacter sphaeroides TaxID=1063 RepID=UPI000B712A18|nr:glycine--tRNA ligase subunit beta [Cereibacter sphaeroides]SNT03170.1 glycyl-tRNA synthetase beta chain [[Luteovulum] sphaeroides subsp. megalophilum]
MPDLLIELFSEEIPARMQARAREDLKKLVTDGLVEAGLTYASAGAFSTPRRLVLSVEGLSAESPTLREERKGPKADAPAAAIEGFLRSTGLTRDRLETREDKKGAVLFAVVEKPGRPASEIVAEVLERTIRTFPWPKSMRWGTGSLRWVRPLQSILCLLSDEAGAEVVPMTLDGLTAGNSTEGHRFMAPARFAVSGFEDYRAKLARAFVMLDASEREQAIWHEATTQAFAQGLEIVPDAALLSEVAGLVEWPVVLMGAIGEDFLGLPPEVLQTSMREHQKFFSVTNPATGRIEKFVTVANRETADHGETILKGNGKVLSARLSDARFFWENDLRTVKTAGLEGMAEGLKQVTFHNRLGSQADRIARIEALAREIAPLVGASPDLSAEAARVAKADLQSAMVGEFPELQGTMGTYYARAAGLPEAVAQACKAHYQPLGPSDAVPTDPVSVAVALADKIDTLTGFWAIGEKPTGSKDPFALRRAALGVIRLLLTNNSRAGLMGIMLPAMNRHLEPFDTSDFTPYERELLAFFHDRLKVHLREQGIRHDVIDACLAMPGNDDLTLLVKRAEALSAFLKTDDGTNLLQGFKRANNILTQAEAKDGVEYSFGADQKFAETDAERALFSALETAEAAIGPALQAEDFAAAMSAMAALRAPIDAFFETVQVNADNAVLRRNRLNMLHSIRATCARVADLTRIEG